MTSLEKPITKRSSSRTRERILLAARSLFAEQGFKAVTVRDVARAAHVTHPLVHRYFGSKQELVEAVMAREVELMATFTSAAPAPTAIEDVIEMASKTMRLALNEGRTSTLLMLRAQIDGVGSEVIEATRHRALKVIIAAMLKLAPSSDEQHDRMGGAIIGAALLGLVAAPHWLQSAAGLEDMSDDEFQDAAVGYLMDIIEKGTSAAIIG